MALPTLAIGEYACIMALPTLAIGEYACIMALPTNRRIRLYYGFANFGNRRMGR